MNSFIDIVKNGEGTLDQFLLDSPKYSQEERELIMEAVYEYVTQVLKENHERRINNI